LEHKWCKNGPKNDLKEKHENNFVLQGTTAILNRKKIGGKTPLYCANNSCVTKRRCPRLKTEGEAKSSFYVSINTVTCPF
jgi:hypothetical protein